MIVKSKPTIYDVLFTINGSILPRIIPTLAGIALISAIAVLASKEHVGIFQKFSAIPFTLIGIALSVFMSFRNNACYARWWEGRKLWGDLIVACRSIGRQTALLDQADKDFLLRGLCGFSAGLVARLRNADEVAAITRWLDRSEVLGCDGCNDVLNQMGRRCLELMRQGAITPIHYSVIERQITSLSHVQAGCERIVKTPVPFAYSLLLHRTALIFCLTLPFSLAGSLDWWTFLPVLLVAYTFFGLDALGHELEDPFSLEPNGLPLGAMQRNIERELLALLGREELPEHIESHNNVLL
jgi:putative membrane protein